MDKDKYRLFLLYLSSMKNLGSKKLKNLFSQMDILEIYNLLQNEKVPKVFLDNDWEKKALEKLRFLESNKIKFTNYIEDDYPVLLKDLVDPPLNIYYKGDISLARNGLNLITVVGTRKPDSYGEAVCKQIVRDLVESGFVIVSGLAFGIDKIAHESAVDFGGKTIAILPFSPETSTPNQNSLIYKKILDKGGLVLSEFCYNVKKIPGLFPVRNRLLANISKSTVVIQASSKSGALITAEIAFSYAREVFAVPGNINNDMSVGTNNLIKFNKAKLVQSAGDILEEFGLNSLKNISADLISLSKEEKIVYNSLLKRNKIFEEIFQESDMDFFDFSSLISLMELKGLIAKNKTGQYFIA